jgi:hypothetical protein
MLHAAGMLFALNATPSPRPNPAPIEIQDCHVAAAGSEFEPWDDYSITFQNKGTADATEIEWMISWKHGPPGEVRSVGSFRPGQTIRQVLRQSENARIVRPFYGVHTPITCSVLFVQFADGTQWNPSP